MSEEKKTSPMKQASPVQPKPILSSTAILKSAVNGTPFGATMKIVGWAAPEMMKVAKLFQCYVANDEDYVMRLTAWNDLGNLLASKLKLGAVSLFLLLTTHL